MNLAYYYHIPIIKNRTGIKVPAYTGVFIKALLDLNGSLILIAHEIHNEKDPEYDFEINDNRLKTVSLGYITPAWHRFLFPRKTLKPIFGILDEVDILLVRAPSPLAPFFFKYFHKRKKIAYLVVGDYFVGSKSISQPWFRKKPIVFLLKRNDHQLKKVLPEALTMVNSFELYEKYKSDVNLLYKVSTSTLSETDFYYRGDTCTGVTLNLLYTGRLDHAKGLKELIEATATIVNQGKDVLLHIVGSEENNKGPIKQELVDYANKLGITQNVIFHGQKTFGGELDTYYRNADIFIMPSYHEGFPRSLWEAMANGLPVIATTVGSIPYELRDCETAILIPPRSSDAISGSINKILIDRDLRIKLIENGRRLASEFTIIKQTGKIICLLKDYIKNQNLSE